MKTEISFKDQHFEFLFIYFCLFVVVFFGVLSAIDGYLLISANIQINRQMWMYLLLEPIRDSEAFASFFSSGFWSYMKTSLCYISIVI